MPKHNQTITIETTKTGFSGYLNVYHKSDKKPTLVCSTGKTLPSLLNNLSKAVKLAL